MKINLFGDKQKKKLFLKESIAAVTIISLAIAVSLVTDAYGQLSQYIDPEDPYNLTKLCDQYLMLPYCQSGEGIMQCLPYYNDTVREQLGFGGEQWDITPQQQPLIPQE